MRAAMVFWGKEVTEVVRTWKGPLVLGAFLLFGVVDPVVARYLKQILGSALGEAAALIPDPTYLSAWQQWTKDLGQLLLIVVIVVAAGSVAGETRSGTDILVLTKPLSAAAFIVTKYATLVGLLVVSAGVGTVAAWLMTRALFPAADEAGGAGLFKGAAAWLALAILMVAAAVLASVLVRNTAGAAAVAVAVYFLLSAVAIWPWADRFTPAGLNGVVGGLLAGAEVRWAWPVASALLLTTGVLLLAVTVFSRQERG